MTKLKKVRLFWDDIHEHHTSYTSSESSELMIIYPDIKTSGDLRSGIPWYGWHRSREYWETFRLAVRLFHPRLVGRGLSPPGYSRRDPFATAMFAAQKQPSKNRSFLFENSSHMRFPVSDWLFLWQRKSANPRHLFGKCHKACRDP